MRRLLALIVVCAGCVGCGGSPANPPGDGGGGDGGGGDGGIDAPGCACETPPPDVCLDATTLQSSRTPGTCTNDTCEFETFTSPCPFGCANGECRPQACTPSCPTAACVDDGCGGTCGPCASGTTFPGVTATNLGIADDIVLAPDGIHLAAIRALQPLPAGCGFNPPRVGTLDLWTVPATGAATRRTLGTRVPLWSVRFTADGQLAYNDNANPCTGRGELWIARADGSRPRRLLSAVSLGARVVGGTVFYSVADPTDPDPSTFDGFVYAAKLPDGAPVRLAKIRYNSFWVPSPTGNAIWLNYSPTAGDLTIYRLDGTSTKLDTATDTFAGFPLWSPDGSKLAFALLGGATMSSLHVIGADGTGRAMLDDACNCHQYDSVAWSFDGMRLAWIQRPPTFGLDAVVHSFAGGMDVVLTGVVSPVTGGQVFRLTFSNDNARLYAAAGSDQNGWKLMSGSVTASGAMTELVPALRPDGNRFNQAWMESPTGTVLAANGADSSTKVVTIGGGTQSVAGIPFEQPQLEPVAASPRWLIQSGGTGLSIYATDGTGGTALPGFQWTSDLESWAFSNEVPFVFGWSGSAALYASNVGGSFFTQVTQDLMASSAAGGGRLGSLVTHYRLGSTPARIYFTTAADGLFWVPRP